MNRIYNRSIKFLYLVILTLTQLFTSCEDFIEIDPPRTETIRETVFNNDESAMAAMNGVYAQMINTLNSMFAGYLEVTCGLVSDELINQTVFDNYIQYETNAILPENNDLFNRYWEFPYSIINNANGVIEGLDENTEINTSLRNQLIGEALFIRAYVHFYLTNLFGPVPYINTTDVETNNSVSRLSEEVVYENIIADLLEAESLLSDDYSFVSNGRKVRPNRAVATALLARAYLYTENWGNAEQAATEVIEQSNLYRLAANLNDVFIVDSEEAIFQLASVNASNVDERSVLGDLFVLVFPPFGFTEIAGTSLQDGLIDAFEPNDARLNNWVGTLSAGSVSFNYANKYKSTLFDPSTSTPEYTTLFRLAEQFLIRAEARAQQGNIPGAQQDLNSIRNRAGLENTTAIDQPSLLNAIMQERRVELFTEGGHRWLDLKRTGRADAVLGSLKSEWQPTDVLFPIPEREFENNANLLPQNPGY